MPAISRRRSSRPLGAVIALAVSLPAVFAQPPPRAFIDGAGPGWRACGEGDFAGVNGNPDTWTWKGDVLLCSGRPIGVMRTREKFTNFELVVEWRHLRSGGNSGVFVWVPDEALAQLKPDALPGYGIEVQMLDHGFREQYEKESGRKGDWFTTHGDIFAVGKSKLTPFPPLSPDGSRSFPRKERSRGVNEWNHYYVRGINGELRLWRARRSSSGTSASASCPRALTTVPGRAACGRRR